MASEPQEFDDRVRLSVYRHFVRRGLAPEVHDLGDELGASPAVIAASLERLAAAHVLVLDRASRRLWMAMPFSAVPTAFRVRTSGGEWWANCAWDALGISAMGALISLATAWALAQAWYSDRLESAWRRRTAAEAQAVFTELGLTDPFWRLAAPDSPLNRPTP